MIEVKKTQKGQEQNLKAQDNHARRQSTEVFRAKKFSQLSAKEKDDLLKALALRAGLLQVE